jgi:CHAD domain-containing protein
MMRPPAPVPHASSTPPAPTIEVERVVSDVVTPKLTQWLADLGNAIPRVIGDGDDEAVHDLRVSLRRIRSLLRVVRPVYGRFYVDVIRDGLRQVARATGSLRDEEVLHETIAAIALDQAHRRAIEPWLVRRTQRERMLRRSVIRMLDSRALDPPVHRLRALLQLPVAPHRDKEVHRFARQVVLDAHLVVDTRRTDLSVSDVVGMHNLRIAYKRLRYAVEAFSRVLPPELRSWGDVAARFQKVLGSLHDHDVAIQVVERVTAMPDAARIALIEALRERRRQIADEYVKLSGPDYLQAHARAEAQPPVPESSS